MAYGINNLGAYGYGNNPYDAGYVPGAVSAAGPGAVNGAEEQGAIKNIGADTEKKVGKSSSPAECQTCANRRYQDGSNENVSFKSPTKISPQAAAGAVRAHENEHVSNAYKKAAMNNGEVLSASVSIKMAICPECGRSYVAGGETRTRIKYTDEENPYQKNKKQNDAAGLRGMNFDEAV